MTKNRVIQMLTVLATALCITVSAVWVVPSVQQQRQDLQLGFAREAEENLPPHIKLIITLLGPLRGLFVDALWYRVEQLKQEGKFFEIYEMSEWITLLQPRFPQVWAFHAWNMAYNVSVQTYTPQERWDWVNKGIRLLREQGLKYNPRAVRLYRELSWIFFHKVGQYSDDMHWYYKKRLAREWQEVLGAPAEGATTEQTLAAMRAVRDAPDTLAALIEQTPAVRTLLDEQIIPLGYDIELDRKRNRVEAYEKLLRELGKVMMYNQATSLEFLANIANDENKASGLYDQRLLPVLQDPANRPAVEALLAHLRKRVLIDRYRMDPDFMVEVMKDFGPLDWRHPSSHGVYWAHLGVVAMGEKKDKEKIDRVNTLRQRIHSLQDLRDSGRVMYDPATDTIDLLPDVRFAKSYETSLEMALDELKEAEHGNDKPYKAGHENFLLKSMVFHYMYGNKAEAMKFRDRAQRLYGQEPHNLRTGRYTLPLDVLVQQEDSENRENLDQLRQYIDGKLYLAFMQGLRHGRRDIYDRMIQMAANAYKQYQKKQVSTSISPTQKRMGLLPFNEVLARSFTRIMQTPSEIGVRWRIWSRAPLFLQQYAFDIVRPRLYTEAQRTGLDPQKAFPVPPGIEKIRAERQKMRKALENPDAQPSGSPSGN